MASTTVLDEPIDYYRRYIAYKKRLVYNFEQF